MWLRDEWERRTKKKMQFAADCTCTRSLLADPEWLRSQNLAWQQIAQHAL